MKKILSTIIGATMITQAEASQAMSQVKESLMNDAYDHLGARALHYTAEVKLADCIDPKGSTLPEICEQLQEFAPGAKEDCLERILHVLQNHSLIMREGNKYYLTEKGGYLCSDHPGSVRASIAKEYDFERWKALGHIYLSVNGGNAFRDTHEGLTFYEYLQANPQANTLFNQGMSNYSQLEH